MTRWISAYNDVMNNVVVVDRYGQIDLFVESLLWLARREGLCEMAVSDSSALKDCFSHNLRSQDR